MNPIPNTPHYFIEIRKSLLSQRHEIVFGKLYDIQRFRWYKKYFFASKTDFQRALVEDLKNRYAQTQRDVLLFFHGMWGDKRPFMAASVQDMERAFMQHQATKIGLTVSIIWHADRIDYLRSHRKSAHLAKALSGDFVDLMDILFQNNQIPHVLAHSMGNQLFLQLFVLLGVKASPSPPEGEELPSMTGDEKNEVSQLNQDVQNSPPSGRRRGAITHGKLLFQQIIMTAADVRDNVFEKNEPLEMLPHWAKRISVYFRKNDAPVNASRLLHRNKRLGLSGAANPVQGVEQIDTSDIADETDMHARANRHLYYHASPRILTDERAVFNGIEGNKIDGRVLKSDHLFRLE